MNGNSMQNAVEHLSSILSRYEKGDLNRYSYDEIQQTINSLELFRDMKSADYDLDALCGLVNTIISHLYVANGYATPNVPRNFEYYQSMNVVRSFIQQIKHMR